MPDIYNTSDIEDGSTLNQYILLLDSNEECVYGSDENYVHDSDIKKDKT